MEVTKEWLNCDRENRLEMGKHVSSDYKPELISFATMGRGRLWVVKKTVGKVNSMIRGTLNG
jgi:hypothetical protein